MKEKILRITVWIISVTSITELALCQFSIKIMRLSAAEHTGISYFAFIIFGLVTLFTVSRMIDSFFNRFFAVIMSFVTSLSGFWCLKLLFSDEIFFKNLYYTLNRQTDVYELLPVKGLISASIPVALLIIGILAYCLCALVIITVSIVSTGKKQS